MKKHDNYINGQWVASENYEINVNPSDLNDEIGEFARANEEYAQLAIDAAENAADDWAASTPQERFNILDFIGTEILKNATSLGDLLSREEGKTLPEAIGEVTRAGQIFKYFAGETLRLKGDILPSVRPEVDVEITREPVGVVGLITPWNFPIAIPAWKIAPALAYGNCVVFKPAELVNASAWALVEIISRSGLPAGVLNLVMGEGSVVGEIMSTSEQINALSFTGSVSIGEHIRENIVKNGGKIQLEMGGKNPLVVMEDADLDVAVNCAIQGAYYSTGQRCTASSRLIIHANIYDAFSKKMIAQLEKLNVGDARDANSQIGPVSSAEQLHSNLAFIDIANKEGGTILFGDQSDIDTSSGHYMRPVLIGNTNNDMRINQEEIFGPVASMIKVADFNEALEVANDVEFGLCAGICTKSLKYMRQFKRKSQAGMVMVNLPTAGVDYHVPFGGTKGSSYGSREQGAYAKEFYTNVKTAYIFAT